MADASGDLARVKSDLEGRGSRQTTGAMSRDINSQLTNNKHSHLSQSKFPCSKPIPNRWLGRRRRKFSKQVFNGRRSHLQLQRSLRIIRCYWRCTSWERWRRWWSWRTRRLRNAALSNFKENVNSFTRWQYVLAVFIRRPVKSWNGRRIFKEFLHKVWHEINFRIVLNRVVRT